MAENIDILVIGAGPGGLACATLLAQQGANVALVERKAFIGPKVCAGGITWGGLIKHVPPGLIERGFPQQHVITRLQRVVVAETNPIIATISRERLGQWMADKVSPDTESLLPVQCHIGDQMLLEARAWFAAH
jgi:geranylgeranyl reductase